MSFLRTNSISNFFRQKFSDYVTFLAVKRLMREAQELAEPTYDYFAQPLSDNLFEWHFTVRGPAETEFDGGIYHGRIVLPPDYPMKPPNIIVLTVNIFPGKILYFPVPFPEFLKISQSIFFVFLEMC